MIQGKTLKDGEPLYIIGLSQENIKRLQDNKPIHFQGKDAFELEGSFLIFAGDTEAEMTADLIQHINVKEVIDKSRKSK